MKATNSAALKEWAALEHALATGATSVLLRKGGLWERGQDFEVEHREFWLYPTRFHQSAGELRPEFGVLAGAARASQPADVNTLEISTYAVVAEARHVAQIEALSRISEFHPYAATTVASRFAYRNRPGLHVLLLRAFRLPQPCALPVTLGYEGCVSWVRLEAEIATAGAKPVIAEREFEKTRERLLDLLEGCA